MSILLTGAAGFIGYHTAQALLARGEEIIGIDNLNSYYDVRLKQARLNELQKHGNFHFAKLDLADRDALPGLIALHPDIDQIVHLAAQAGVRHSLIDPFAYVSSNVMGHLSILEVARRLPALRHLVYASSSSVYGANTSLPFREQDRVDTPLSVYAATKRADELLSYTYGHLFSIPQTGLRFFTVYGPWGRPDMAYFMFAEAIATGRPLTVYDGGRLKRDFTYIDDIVAGVVGCLDHPPALGETGRVLNIGNNQNETVADLIGFLESALGRRAIIQETPRPLADVTETFADIGAIAAITGFTPCTPLALGIPRFVDWYRCWRSQMGSSQASAV
jgi:UDP-glucuronate 4-epimerase